MWLAGRFLEAVYTHPSCQFEEYVKVIRARTALTDQEYQDIMAELLTPGSNREDVTATEVLLDLFLTGDDLPRADLEAATGLGTKALGSRIKTLRQHRLVLSGRRGYRKTPRFVELLRRWAAPNGPNVPNGIPGNDRGGVSHAQ